MNSFDERARTWDNNPVNWERAQAIAQKIQQKVDLSPEMVAMEYGAGTGILSFILKDSLKEITLMDNSIEMVKVMQDKIEKGKVAHLRPLYFDLENDEYSDKTFDLIFTQMVMHHVADIPSIFTKFYGLLNKNGKLIIADLYKEDGSFHGDGFTGHLGFDPEDLGLLLKDSGFNQVESEPCFVMKKQTERHGLMEFPLFILTAVKS